MNLLGLQLVRELVCLLQQAEADDTFRVLVFKSADPDFFSHVDVTRIKENREAARLTGEAKIALLLSQGITFSRITGTGEKVVFVIVADRSRIRAVFGGYSEQAAEHCGR